MKGFKKIVALTGIISTIAMSSVAAYAAPVMEINPTKFIQYNCTNLNVSLLFPDTWMYIEENSTDENYLFFGPGDYSYVELSRIKFESEEDIIPINYFAEGVYEEYTSNGFVALSDPAVIQFGDEFGMICGYVVQDQASQTQTVYFDVMSIQDNNIILLSFGDEMNSFIENVNDYNVIINSFTNNPSDAGLLQKYVSDAFPLAGTVPESLMQGYIQWVEQNNLAQLDFMNPQNLLNYSSLE